MFPDGKNLVFVSEGCIWSVPIHGKVDPDIAGEPVKLTEEMGAWNMSNMMLAWSADGKWIAFTASKGGDTELWLMEDFLPLIKDKK